MIAVIATAIVRPRDKQFEFTHLIGHPTLF